MKYINFILLILLFNGCAPSSIKISGKTGDNAYTMFGMVPERSFYLPVVLADSVVEKWEGEVNGNFTNSSVVVSDSFVFVNDLSGRITTFRVDNGKRVGQLKNKGTVATTPVLHKVFVIYADAYNKENRSDLIFYDFTLGQIAYEAEVPGRVLSQLIKTSDGIILVTENGIACRFNFLGHKLWETKTNIFTHSSPALSEEKLIFGTDNGEIITLDARTGMLLYRKQLSTSFFGSASVSGGIAYIGSDNGNLYAIDVETGEVKWTFETGSRIIANPVMDEENIVMCNLKGNIYKLSLDKGILVWKQSTGGVINAAPLLTKNRVIVPDLSGKIYFVNYESGIITKTLTFSTRIRLSPLIVNRNLYIGFDKGTLKSYEVFY